MSRFAHPGLPVILLTVGVLIPAGGLSSSGRGFESALESVSSASNRPRQAPAGKTKADSPSPRANGVEIVRRNEKGHEPATSSPPAKSAGDSKFDSERTSWQDPFHAKFWRSSGWKFDGKSMRSRSKEPAEATFRRSYRRVRVDLQIEPLEKPGVFEVRLVVPASKNVTTVTIGNDAVVVAAKTPKRENRVIKRKKVDLDMAPGRPGVLGIVATGNRIVIVWNRRRVLNCLQPAGQSGRKIEISLATARQGFAVSKLRIEGE